jgi:hypothetical protein
MVVALIALFISLGGVSYGAAVVITGKTIKNNTVGTKDLKNNDIRGKDVRRNTLTGSDIVESKLGKVPSSASADSATNATNADNSGTVGGVSPSALLRSDGEARSGTVLRGVYNITGGAAGAAASLGTGEISFGLRFATAPTVRLIPVAGAPPAGCSGTAANPVASPGFVCVFDQAAVNAGALNNNSPARQGVTLFFTTAGVGTGFHAGTWAATAP